MLAHAHLHPFSTLPSQIQSTAGAISVLNDKGELSMKKVKVYRYVSGRRPKFAPEDSDTEDSDQEDFPVAEKFSHAADNSFEDKTKSDARLRRLGETREPEVDSDDDNRLERHREIHDPTTGIGALSELESEDEKVMHQLDRDGDDDSSEGEELDEDEIERRRLMIHKKALEKEEEEELLGHADDDSKSESESVESESETDSEDELEQRLKPVFVRKRDRVTVEDKDEQARKEKELELQAKKQVEERRRETLKMIEDEARKELLGDENVKKEVGVNTDDENDETSYEAWKLRELRRIKRDKDERESYERQRNEIDRIHGMTEEQRRIEERNNPRIVTNKSTKGKYKFLQKYFHRGAFFLNEEDTVYKRDFSAPTLEDHFDKTVLPKVMQVKNFGRSGRTKYTHLVDQDTTLFDSPWMAETAQNIKFHHNQVSTSFERPSVKKRKK